MTWLGLATAALSATGCAAEVDDGERRDAPAILGDDDKADGATGVELVGRIAPGTPGTATLTSGTARIAFAFYGTAGTTVDLEVTRSGSATGLDTVLRVHGPRDAAGVYGTQLAEDDDAGYAKLSRLGAVRLPTTGFYLAEVAARTPGALGAGKAVRLTLGCTGTCTSTEPIAPASGAIRWVTDAAEYQAATIGAYATARARLAALAAQGLPARWAVVLDIDETTLSNAGYERRRAELGVGYSKASWDAWVAAKAAPAIPGVVAFVDDVHARGGTVVMVSNRKEVGEGAPTRANLVAVGVRADATLFKTTTSDKNPRFAAIEAGTAGLPAMPVLLYVGDNIQDFPDLDQSARDDAAALAAFADRFVMLPNPMYGSWED